MNNDRSNIIYQADDIERYFSGQLSPAAMHGMEKAALDDPLLADAMDGYEAMKNEPWKKELIEAKTAIAAKETAAKLVVLPARFNWKKAVAAVLVVGCGAALVYKISYKTTPEEDRIEIAAIKKNNDNAPVIKNDSAAVAIATPLPPNTAASTTGDKHAPLIAVVRPAPGADENFTTGYNKKVRQKIRTNPNGAVSRLALTDTVASETANAAVAMNNMAAEKKKEPVQNKESANSKSEPALNHRFSAGVTAPDNTPLPFANIVVKQENFGTYADVKGRFGLVAADSTITVEVRAAGYVPQTYTLKSGAVQNNIVLSEVPFPSKDVIQLKNKKTAASGIASRHAMQMDTVMDVEPSDGWGNYNTYLSNNLALPEEIVKKNIHGEVEVSFDVQSNGVVNNVNIAKSLCDACDEEALRVIRQGPQWKVKKGKKGKVKIKF